MHDARGLIGCRRVRFGSPRVIQRVGIGIQALVQPILAEQLGRMLSFTAPAVPRLDLAQYETL